MRDLSATQQPDGARRFFFTVSAGGQRLDQYLADRLREEGLTRSRLQQLIREGLVLVNGAPRKAGHPVQPGDGCTVLLPPPAPSELAAAPVDFTCLYEDEDILVLAKPPGVVVHPACGTQGATLAHGLLHHCRHLSGVNGESRPGIVHRLDKDTSGVMVVAKCDAAHHALVDQFKGREVKKVYQAIVQGIPATKAGRIDLPLGRHPVQRKKMAVRPDGRAALTEWRLLESFPAGFAFLEIRLHTGRTHQIRVHLASVGCPVAGDATYGRKSSLLPELGIVRQCLHARTLAFAHPRTGEPLEFTAPLWPDMLRTLELLRQGAPGGRT